MPKPAALHLPLNNRGAALIFALLVSIAVAAMALGAILLSSGARLTTRYSATEAALQAAANGGLEIIRDSLNRGIFDTLLPANGYTTLANNAAVLDASGAVIPGFTRSLYVGRTGGRTGGSATAGQYGSNFASGLSVIRNARGAVAARRLLMTQESWSKFAVAINKWPGSAVYGCTESINGPFHSNDVLRLMSGCNPKIPFSGPATVVGIVQNQGSGNFSAGLKTGAPAIAWPTPARISLMQQYAQDADAVDGDYDLTSLTTGQATPGLRIEFLTVDVNANGTIEWDEGYMRVWRPAATQDSILRFATGRLWEMLPAGGATGVSTATDPNMISRTCGAVITLNGNSRWYSANEIWTGIITVGGSVNEARDGVRWSLSGGATGTRPAAYIADVAATNRRCYLGGDPQLYTATQGTALTPDSMITNTPLATNNFGWWIKRRTGPFAPVAAVRSDAEYLIPLGRNPNFKGVIFVDGDVAISGRVRGRMSVFATGNIVLADDLLYHNAPGSKCDSEGDIFGAIATINLIISDNSVQAPFRINNTVYGGFDDTPVDEQYNMFGLAAGTAAAGTGNFVTQGLYGGTAIGPIGPSVGLGTVDRCGATAAAGPAGCIRITGGLAQGRVEYATYITGNRGFAEAHAYDKCGQVNPPPYFPTTGRFIESRYYEIDPVWLNNKTIPTYFSELRAQ